MSLRRKIGSLDPIVYFTEPLSGRISLPPTSDTRCPTGWIREEADTLQAIDCLQKRLQQQVKDEMERENERDEKMWAERLEQVRSDLSTRMCSAATSEYEREFIRLYLQLREEKREKHRERFAHRVAYLEMREHDRARTPDEFLNTNVHEELKNG